MPDSIESLIYDEVQRGLALQPLLLNELRARTGILLAVIGGSTSFLGAAAVSHNHLGTWGVAALVAFVLAIACCLFVLSPHREWTFSSRAATLVGNYVDQETAESGKDWSLSEAQRDLALHMGDWVDANVDAMKEIQRVFFIAGLRSGSAPRPGPSCWMKSRVCSGP